jgi:hypothetical protein
MARMIFGRTNRLAKPYIGDETEVTIRSLGDVLLCLQESKHGNHKGFGAPGEIRTIEFSGSPGWIRTSDHSINSRMLYR